MRRASSRSSCELPDLLPGAAGGSVQRGLLTAVADAISTGWVNWILTVLLIVFFAYFYTSMVFNPEETADNLRKQGGFIPGVRPGTATVTYIKNVLHRVTLPGGIFIAAIAVVPTIIFYFTGNTLIQRSAALRSSS